MGVADQPGGRTGAHCFGLQGTLDGGEPFPNDEVDSGNAADYHQRDEPIPGHVFCSFLTLLLKRTLEERLEAKGELGMGRGSTRVRKPPGSGGAVPRQAIRVTQQAVGDAHKAFMAAGVALPPPLREKL